MFFKLKKNTYTTLSMAEAAKELEQNPNIHLIDVRSTDEYKSGHIPKSINIPLSNISLTTQIIKDKDAKIFVYCLSGARSRQAASVLYDMGYTDVSNIGGISQWRGLLER